MPSPWPTSPPSAADRAAVAAAEPTPLWFRSLPEDLRCPPLAGRAETDLCIVGGGFTGLWAALHAKADDPARDVVVLEADRVGTGASGRNGGFVVGSLTHGLANGAARFERELATLERLGHRNFAGLVDDVARLGIDCDLELTGELTVALEPHELTWLAEHARLLRVHGHEVTWLDREAMRAEVASPTYLGGLWDRTDAGLLDPGKLAAGLRRAALDLGVRIHERSAATGLRAAGAGMQVLTAAGGVTARKVLLATSAHPSLLRTVRRRIAPVYDQVLVTEPLAPDVRATLGWPRRQGLSDSANQFHYYRLTADDRLLWGGYDAIWRRGGPVGPAHEHDDGTYARLAQHLRVTFPQLDGVAFSHRWGGAIDTCSRFFAFYGLAHERRVGYVAGYTGLGVGASRFGARTALDLLDGRDTEATRLRSTRRRPVAFPSEPVKTAVIQLTRNRLAAADRAEGRRGLWLRALDRAGLGFDS